MAPSKRPARRLPTEPVDEEATVAPSVNGDDDDDDDDDDDTPVARSRGMTEDEVSEIKGGWTEGDKQMASTSSYAQTLKLEEKAQVIKFLDDTPYANFRRHWVERTTKDSGKTIRAYGCPKTVGKECPLCDAGDRPQAVAAFNIAIVGDDDNLVLKSWDVGPRLFQVLKGYANDPKIGPLTKGFFIASRTGKRGTTQHNVSPVSRTALEEDYDITPPSKDSLDKLAKDKYTPKIVEIAKAKDLRELAEEMADEYE